MPESQCTPPPRPKHEQALIDSARDLVKGFVDPCPMCGSPIKHYVFDHGVVCPVRGLAEALAAYDGYWDDDD